MKQSLALTVAVQVVVGIVGVTVGVAGPHQADARQQDPQNTIARPDFRGKITGDAPGHVLMRINYVDGGPDTMRYTVRSFDYYCEEPPGVAQDTSFNVRKAEFVDQDTFDRDRSRLGFPNRTRFHGRLLPDGTARGFFSYYYRPSPNLPRDNCATDGRLRWTARAVDSEQP